MCDFLSFVIVPGDRWKILAAPSLISHTEIENLHQLPRNAYREAEWVYEGEADGLFVRCYTERGECEDDFRAYVLSLYPTRADLLRWLLTRPYMASWRDKCPSGVRRLIEQQTFSEHRGSLAERARHRYLRLKRVPPEIAEGLVHQGARVLPEPQCWTPAEPPLNVTAEWQRAGLVR